MAPDPPSAGGIDKQQPTGDRSGKSGWWQASERRQSHGNNDGRQRARVVDVRVGGWTAMVKTKAVATVTAKVKAVSRTAAETVGAVAVTTQR